LYPITEKQSSRLKLNKSITEGEKTRVAAPDLIFNTKINKIAKMVR
jgi:hypothetical protein